jgi:hypothetical protein
MLRRLRVITILPIRSTGIKSGRIFQNYFWMLLDPGEPGFCGFCRVFKGCFGNRGSQSVVILWFQCGEMRGKCGHRDDSF